jgi:hypothetical protein
MRELKTSDMFVMSRILKKINIKNEIDVKDKTQEEVGTQVLIAIGENLYLAEQEINTFMSGLIGITADEFSNLSIADSAKHFADFKNLKGVSDFLKLAAGLMR